MNKSKSTKAQATRKSINKKNYRSVKDKCPKVATDPVVAASDNDYSWWGKNEELAKAAASIPLSNVLGLPLNLGKGGIAGYTSASFTFPGIMKFSIVPTFGISSDFNSDVNIMQRTYYAWQRHANSGSRNYEGPDYATYILAMDSLLAYFTTMARIYGIVRTYSQVNRYIAKPLVEALGVDYDDVVANLADFRYAINNFAIKANSWAIPASLDVFKRHIQLAESIYKDSDIDKAQLYAFDYQFYYKWNGIKYNTGSCLEAVKSPTHGDDLATVAELKAFGDSLLNAMLSNEDIGIMSGDTLKAWGESALLKFPGLPEDYATLPEYNEMMLCQIHHIIPVGELDTNAPVTVDNNEFLSIDIFQSQNALYYMPKVKTINPDFGGAVINGTVNISSPILDCGYKLPDHKYVIEATRFMALIGTMPTDSSTNVSIITCGTEFVTKVSVYTLQQDDYKVENIDNLFVKDFQHLVDNVPEALLVVLSQFSDLSKFDWAPIFYLSMASENHQNEVTFRIFGDVYNYGLISRNNLENINHVCLLSALNITNLGVRG